MGITPSTPEATALMTKVLSQRSFPHFMCDENAILKQDNGQPVYADNGGNPEEIETERTILVHFFTTGEIPSKHFIREGGSFKRDPAGELVSADNGGTVEETAAEKAMIEFLLKQTPSATQKPIKWYQGWVKKILGKAT